MKQLEVALARAKQVLANRGHSGAPCFEQHILNQAQHPIVDMRIVDFLTLAARGYKPEKQAKLEHLLDQGTLLNSLPYLRLEHHDSYLKVVGHEGRHRARVLQARGYESMPVELRTAPHVVLSGSIATEAQKSSTRIAIIIKENR